MLKQKLFGKVPFEAERCFGINNENCKILEFK